MSDLYNKARESFVTARAQQEQVVLKFRDQLEAALTVNPELFRDIKLPEEITLQSLVPALYAEYNEYTEEECAEQYRQAKALFESVMDVVRTQNEEAMKCLQEYQVYSSSDI